MNTLARTSPYSPTEPESGVFAAAPKATTDSLEDLRQAREAIYAALIVLANAASRLGGGR
jgi:hypothetical protein